MALGDRGTGCGVWNQPANAEEIFDQCYETRNDWNAGSCFSVGDLDAPFEASVPDIGV